MRVAETIRAKGLAYILTIVKSMPTLVSLLFSLLDTSPSHIILIRGISPAEVPLMRYSHETSGE